MNNANILRFPKLESTNNYLINNQNLDNGTIVITDNQYGGHGLGTNKWESSVNENLTFSILLKPKALKASEQFFLNIIISLAIREYITSKKIDGCKIKWPNDIYVNDKKICGILINNTILSNGIVSVVAGIGLNINQETFASDAPNPISLRNITKKTYSLEKELTKVIMHINYFYNKLETKRLSFLKEEYLKNMYRKDEFHEYIIGSKKIEAQICGIAEFGLLLLEEADGTTHTCDLKEVQYII
ncbi:MAG: biotin--[acetyl-CoA-carboxylase] ligase [Bacteroidota bacterium]|nr:biotin--[acetyl-CoA-carboxylase] ligase [Bacteroidota bacterium]